MDSPSARERKIKESKPAEGQNNVDDNGSNEPQAKRWAWMESKLFLLLIGAVTTGFVVPWLQYTQQTVTWIRENRHSYLEHHLEAARGALKEFTAVHAIVVEAHQRATIMVRSSVRDKDSLIQYRDQVLETRNQLSRQVGHFVGAWSYFSEDEQQALGAAFERYEAAIQSLWYQLDQVVEAAYGQPRSSEKRRNQAAIDTVSWGVVGQETTNTYRDVFRLLAQHIKMIEDESLSLLTLRRSAW